MVANIVIFQGIEVRNSSIVTTQASSEHILGGKAGKNILILSNRERGASDFSITRQPH